MSNNIVTVSNTKIKIAIHGSCCSREIFNSPLNTFELGVYLFQNPPHTMFEKPFPMKIKEDEVSHNSNFMRRMVASEFNKSALQTLKNNPADYLMIDVGDLRLGRFNVRFDNGKKTRIFKTDDTEKEILQLKEQLKNFDFTTESSTAVYEEEWDFLIHKYAAELKKIYPVNKIILNRIAIASQYEKDGVLVDFTEKTGGATFKSKDLLLRLQDKLEKELDGCLILDNPPFPVVADPNHKLKLHLLHLNQDVYDWKMKRLREMLIKQTDIITVKNADGEPDTQAQIIIQNKIDYTPKVSVIIPVYNTEEYLRECMDSVINQTLKEIEIICVDDGSTDGSLSILKEYAKKDERITVITQENQGAGVARNAGLKIAAGEYLLILDADDIFDHNFIEKLYNQAQKTDAEITMCRASLLDNQTKQVQKVAWTLKASQMPTSEVFGAEDVKNHTFTFCVGWSWDKLYRADFVRRHNLKFQNLRSSNDLLFVFLSVALAQRMTVVDDYLILHRRNTGSSLSQTRSKDPLCFARAMTKLKEKLSAYGLYGLHERAFVNWAADFCLWHVRTIDNGEAGNIICEYLKENLDTIMDLHLDDPDYYYDKKIYWSMRSLLADPPKVSVIMPCYNTAPYLRQALDSVVNQTLKDIEIICVNDGSTDNTLDIIKEYAARDKRIVVIDGPNGGYGKAMNKGLDAAMGEYIGILEPDDYLELDIYETLYKKVKETNVDFVKGDIWFWWSEKNERKYSNIINNKNLYDRVQNDLSEMGLVVGTIANYAGIYKTQFIRNYNIRYNETPGASFQDQGFYYQVTFNAKSALFINKPVYHYRKDNMHSSINTPGKVVCIFEEYKFIFNKFNKLPHKERFLTLIYTKMIDSYLWNLSRSEKSIYPIIRSKVAEEFKKAVNDGLSKKIVGENIWERVIPFLNLVTIPIILSSDDNYAPYMYVTMYSALENAMPDTFYDFYLLVPSAFSKRNTDLIMELKEKYNCDIHFIDMKNAFLDMKMHLQHITYQTYYRLLIGDVLPKKYDKCIYLDVDVCVCKDLSELYNTDIGDNYIGACRNFTLLVCVRERLKKLNLDPDKYFNAGVLLINAKKWRDLDLKSKFLHVATTYSNLDYMDQDTLNIVCKDNIKWLKSKWNFMWHFLFIQDRMSEQDKILYTQAQEDLAIIHYTSDKKPWKYPRLKYADVWWKYAQSMENKEITLNTNNKPANYSPLLYKDIGLGCNTWCAPQTMSGNAYTYDLSDNIYTRYVSWDPIKEGSCDVEILRLSAVEKRSKRVVEFPVDKIISSGKITGSKVEFRNQKCWIGCAVEGAYESFTVEASVSRV